MTGQMNAYLLLAAPMAPLAGAIVTGIGGTGFIRYKISQRVSHLFCITCVLLSFLISLYALYNTSKGVIFNDTIYSWVSSGSFDAGVGFMVDSLTAFMMCIVTSISLLVHIYSVGYMKEDPGNSRFFASIAFFTFSMLMLVMANNFLLLFFGWEAVGLASYLLIGFWFEKPAAATAGTKAFLINRVSDAAFLSGIALLFSAAGSFQFNDIFLSRYELATMTLPGTDWRLITVSCLCLFIGAMGKSAQFPLHVWLPDSMEGPTPVSALIHAATMVTAGIFMVCRMSPLFELSETVLSLMLIIGAITALFMGLVAMAQNDIKQVIAYSTISQLGYMTMALGASAYSAALFHLMTHAFFKALLFLAAGVVILGMNHDQDIRNMGGLKKYMPVTWITALVASLSLAGFPFFSGFYSKDSILMAIKAANITGSGFAFTAAFLGIFITAFYTFRLFFLVFHGKARWKIGATHLEMEHEKIFSGEHVGILPGEKPHNAPRIMTLPLIILALPACLIGFLTVEPVLFGDFLKTSLATTPFFNQLLQKISPHFSAAFSMTLHGALSPSFLLVLTGVGTAGYFYLFNPRIPDMLAKKLHPIYKLLVNQYYLNQMGAKMLMTGSRISTYLLSLGERTNFSEKWVARLALYLGNTLWRIGETRLIDGLIVNGSARAVTCLSSILRHLQSGYLYHYAFAMIISLLLFLLYFFPLSFWN